MDSYNECITRQTLLVCVIVNACIGVGNWNSTAVFWKDITRFRIFLRITPHLAHWHCDPLTFSGAEQKIWCDWEEPLERFKIGRRMTLCDNPFCSLRSNHIPIIIFKSRSRRFYILWFAPFFITRKLIGLNFESSSIFTSKNCPMFGDRLDFSR